MNNNPYIRRDLMEAYSQGFLEPVGENPYLAINRECAEAFSRGQADFFWDVVSRPLLRMNKINTIIKKKDEKE